MTLKSARYILLIGLATVATTGFSEKVAKKQLSIVPSPIGSSPTTPWVKQIGEKDKDTKAYALTTDRLNNLIVAGATTGSVGGNSSIGKKDLLLIKYDSLGVKQWVRRFGSADKATIIYSVATDQSGNIIVSGDTDGNLDGSQVSAVSTYKKLFLIKYDPDGKRLWIRELYANNAYIHGRSVAVDPKGNILVVGYSSGGLDGNALSGPVDLVVIKYDKAGNKRWVRHLGVNGGYTYASSVATDSYGNIFVGCDSNGPLDGNQLKGFRDSFLVKYSPRGIKQWTRQLGVDSGYTFLDAVAVDQSGSIYVTGYVDRGLDDDLFLGLDGNPVTGHSDVYLVKFVSDGTQEWIKESGIKDQDTHGESVAVDRAGDVYVAGYTTSAFDKYPIERSWEAFVSKYDSRGANQWTRNYRPTKKAVLFTSSVAVDELSNIFVGGYIGAGGIGGNSSKGIWDLFVVKYNYKLSYSTNE